MLTLRQRERAARARSWALRWETAAWLLAAMALLLALWISSGQN